MLKISKLSKFCKKRWFIYSNSDFDEIFKIIIVNLDYDYIELRIWSAELHLFSNIEHVLIYNDNKFSTIKINKSNCIKILEPTIYEEIRLFEIKIFNNGQKLFDISSDNYGEHTSITMDKTVSEENINKLLYIIDTKK